MGATTFIHYVAGNDANKAFRSLVSAAAADYGQTGYSGSVSEKDTFVMIDGRERSFEDARKEADELLDGDDPRISDKYGPAGMLKVRRGEESGFLVFGWAPE